MKVIIPRSSLCRSSFLGALLMGTLVAAGSLPVASAHHAGASVTLKLIQWNNPPAVAAIAKINAAFEKANPGITIQVTSVPSPNYNQLVQTRLAAKDVDILAQQALSGAPSAWTPGLLKPLWQQFADAGDFLSLSGQPFLKNYFPNALASASTYNGKVLSITTGSYIYSGMYYNKTMFKKYGLSVPTTWSQLMHVASVLKSHGISPFVDGGKSGWPLGVVTQGIMSTLYPNLTALDQGLWTGKVKFTDPTGLEVYTRSQQIFQNMLPGFMGIDYIGSVSQFAAGRAAMYPTGTWDGPAIATANPSLDFGYFQTPGSDNPSNNKNFGGKYDLAWLVASHSQNQAAALKWLAYFSQPAVYSIYVNAVGIIPSQPNIKLTDPHVQALAGAAAHLTLMPDQVMHSPNNMGKYGGFFSGVVYLAPAGPISTAAQLAAKSQVDWDAAVKLQLKKH